jgi:hypothetical protein
MRTCISPLVAALATVIAASLQAADDPLPVWHDGPAKTSILRFV